MKLLHAADLHLDSPMRGLERYEGAPLEAMRLATRRALENLIECCLAEEVRLLLLAGDLFDGEWKDYSTGLFFAQQMTRLRQGGVEVVLVRGNHDAASQIERHLEHPSNVRELSTRRAESVVYEELGIAVHGQSYGKRAVTEDLAAGYPDALDGVFNIGLLHTCAGGREGHEPYAPCSVETLASKGYDYWALGHVHQREVLLRDPWIVFPGNLQGRHAREIGSKGATLITLRDGRIGDVAHRALDAARWSLAEVDLSEAESGYDAVDLVRAKLEEELLLAEGRPLAVRLRLVGSSAAHGALVDDPERWESAIRAAASDVGEVWIEKIEIATEPSFLLEELSAREDAIGQVARSLSLHAGEVGAFIDDLAELRRKLPREVREDRGLRLDDPAVVRDALVDAQQLLLARLQGRSA
ncbi:MAG TPA: DNA repair exonuclease [Polyangiaceae bacterium]|nr:DNA repair exonuclease [Polyangiaceae bacterium]